MYSYISSYIMLFTWFRFRSLYITRVVCFIKHKMAALVWCSEIECCFSVCNDKLLVKAFSCLLNNIYTKHPSSLLPPRKRSVM